MVVDREKLTALTRLGIARREKLAQEDFRVYLDELARVPAAIVTAVCGELGRQEPGEFEPRFPPLHLVLARCHAKQAEARARKALQFPVYEPAPLAPDKWAEIRAKFQAVLRRRTMP